MRGIKRMKLGVVVLSVFVASAMAVSAAQQPMGGQGAGPMMHGRRNMVEMRLQRMSRILNLTDQQKATIRPILEKEGTQMRAIFRNSSLSREDRRSAFKKLRQKTMREVRPLLTKEQRPKLEEAMAPPRRFRHGRPMTGPPPNGQPPSQQ
jgi:Spy/CpxP family protein refolding chaperone